MAMHEFMTACTDVTQDEMLAHRLGLIPLNIDPRKLQTRQRECHRQCLPRQGTYVMRTEVAPQRPHIVNPYSPCNADAAVLLLQPMRGAQSRTRWCSSCM
jgi:DNA-directed RNA polymerase alpha subunit